MNERNTTHTTLHEALLTRGETDWERLRQEQAAGVEPEADPDEGEFDDTRARSVARGASRRSQSAWIPTSLSSSKRAAAATRPASTLPCGST